MKLGTWIVYSAATALLLACAATVEAQEKSPPPKPVAVTPASPSAPAPEVSFAVTDRFTAQRRPRVTVFDFEDTNAEAKSARYGSSVEAMLVTFLKRKSQFVVVERQNRSLKRLLEEKQRIQHGLTQHRPGDASDRELLEKLDAYILGSVTLLSNVNEKASLPPKGEDKNQETDTAANGPDGTPLSPREEIQGPRIEIDAKLISRFDGRIIAAAQRRGPVACLRSIVERLGIAIEQEYLRPYYGRLRVKIKEPENVHFYLTPILLDNALDEEKPPIEHGSSVEIGADYDKVVPWSTDPTSYTIDTLLSGWYSMRLERPGYGGIGTTNARWVARDSFGQIDIYDRVLNLPLSRADAEERRFVVHVDPLRTDVVDGDANDRSFVLTKLRGSLKPLVKRQYLDSDFSQQPARAVLLGDTKIDLNRVDRQDEYADDRKCDLFDETIRPHSSDFGRTYVASGETFNFDQFKGGELIIEDYKGETVPTGTYKMAYWDPHYLLQTSEIVVRDQDQMKPAKTTLVRETLPLDLEATGRKPTNRGILEGKETHHRVDFPLDFRQTMEQPGLPVDVYSASTNISGLDGWRYNVELLPPSELAPVFDTASEKNKLGLILFDDDPDGPREPPLLKVKTRMGLGGRLAILTHPPDPLAADVFLDDDLLKILNLVLYHQEERPPEEKLGFWKRLFHRDRPTVHPPPEEPPVSAEVVAQASVTAPITRRVRALADIDIIVPVQKKKKSGTTLEVKKVVSPALLPRNPEALRKLLARHLELIDLLVLDPRDMATLLKSREVSKIVEHYVAEGGALFAFVAEPGDYREVVGAPLILASKSHKTKGFELAPGDVADLIPAFEKKVKVKSKRPLPRLGDPAPAKDWRVLAFTEGHTDPRLLELGQRETGGYVALWLDDPESFYGPLGGTVPKVEETRGKVEARIFDWAHYLMYRRYDKSGERARPAAAALSR